MDLTPLHDPSDGPLRVVGLMSGSGTNIRKILEHEARLAAAEGAPPFEVVALFSDRAESRAVTIGKEYDRPVVVRDLQGYCAKRGVSRRDLDARAAFDRETVLALSPFRAKVAAYGGYMSIATEPLIRAFLGINVHPADLSIERPGGGRRFVGDHAVRDALAAGEKTIASSTHIIEPVVDGGRLLMISPPMAVMLEPQWDLSDAVDLARAEAVNQERLKEQGDWVVFPRTLEALARGDFARDEAGALYYRGSPIPRGWRLS
jgi:folate-dependent phosphoribosylglycinamide formyltransferase PurN